jgi:hypothetical protein
VPADGVGEDAATDKDNVRQRRLHLTSAMRNRTS